jgi:ketosteroid isomerase-like protein
MKPRHVIAATLALLALPVSLRAQNTAVEKEVYAVVENFFKAFNAKDTTAMRTHLYGDVKLFTTGTNPQGAAVVRSESASGLLASIAGAPVALDERISNPEVLVEDGLANVWVRYEFYADGKYSHCGIDSFLLVKTGEGWKIAALADTRRKTCDGK